jgi:hypothetical protein
VLTGTYILDLLDKETQSLRRKIAIISTSRIYRSGCLTALYLVMAASETLRPFLYFKQWRMCKVYIV